METVSKKPNYGITFGLISGLILCIITLIQYLGGIKAFMSPLGFASYVILIVMAVLAGRKQKQSNDGYLQFGQALKVTFAVFAIALLLQTIFSYVLFNFVDPSFKEALSQEILNKQEEWMKRFGASDTQIEEALEKKRGQDQFSIGNILLGYAISCIVSFIFCLIIAAIIKKNRPAFQTPNQ